MLMLRAFATARRHDGIVDLIPRSWQVGGHLYSLVATWPHVRPSAVVFARKLQSHDQKQPKPNTISSYRLPDFGLRILVHIL